MAGLDIDADPNRLVAERKAVVSIVLARENPSRPT
jgi:hypothetical protein